MFLDITSTPVPTLSPVYYDQFNQLLDLGYTATSVLVFLLLIVVVWLLYRLFKFIL